MFVTKYPFQLNDAFFHKYQLVTILKKKTQMRINIPMPCH